MQLAVSSRISGRKVLYALYGRHEGRQRRQAGVAAALLSQATARPTISRHDDVRNELWPSLPALGGANLLGRAGGPDEELEQAGLLLEWDAGDGPWHGAGPRAGEDAAREGPRSALVEVGEPLRTSRCAWAA